MKITSLTTPKRLPARFVPKRSAASLMNPDPESGILLFKKSGSQWVEESCLAEEWFAEEDSSFFASSDPWKLYKRVLCLRKLPLSAVDYYA